MSAGAIIIIIDETIDSLNAIKSSNLAGKDPETLDDIKKNVKDSRDSAAAASALALP